MTRLRPPAGTSSSGASTTLADRGAWATSTAYLAGDRVAQGGVDYLCATAHTAGTFATDLAAGKWIETGINSTAAVALSNTAPNAVGGTAAAGTATTAMRSDAVLPAPGLGALLWGDGTHGSLTFDGTTGVTVATRVNGSNFTMTPSSSVYTMACPLVCSSLTVNAGVTLKTNGWPIFCTGTATINGTIDSRGGNASGATAGARYTGGYLGFSGNGGNGNTGAGSNGSSPPNGNLLVGADGGNGGAGASGAAGTKGGGFGVGYTDTLLTPFTRMTGVIVNGNATQVAAMNGGGGGGGGGGDGTNAGGGGGAGGGLLLLNARILAGSGTMTAAGGNGANGVAGNAGGGGGGGGGAAIVNTSSSTGWSGTITAAGGTAGSGVGTGATASAGNTGVVKLTTWT